MGDRIHKFVWTLGMAWQLRHWGWSKSWRNAYHFARSEAWQEYRMDGMTPREAIIEDASYVP